MPEQQTWRMVLGNIIQDPLERQRIADSLGVNSITLVRWANDDSNPRPRNLQQLLLALPQQRQLLRDLIAEEFGEAFARMKNEPLMDVPQEVPSAFYTSVLQVYATIPLQLRFWSVSNLVLQQALGQLDPNQVGLIISLAQCNPPMHGKKIRSLRERVGRGTLPWKSIMDQQAILLGSESLAGRAVSTYHQLTFQDRTESQSLFPSHWTEWEESASVCPIMFDGRIAGCLLVSSTQPNYFLPFRETLIQHYARLIVLAFEPHEFYELQDIELHPMPPYQEQEPYFGGFRQRITAAMVQSTQDHRSITIAQAEQLAWQQLEEEFLRWPLSSGL
ncbi:MAG: GAF domain-containing protein [Chloroflexota bacterium]|nr:GAF domain-containing protein [Chloroflexota bacterium]